MDIYFGYFYLWQLILLFGVPLSSLFAIIVLELCRRDIPAPVDKITAHKSEMSERHLPLKRRHLPLFKKDNSWVIRHIEEETKTKIMFVFDSLRRPERQLLITGPLEGVAEADKMIRKAIQDKSNIDVYEMCIDMELMEKFIGKEADIIKDIQGITGTCVMIRCEIDPLTGPLGKVIITGTCSEISKAIPLVEQKLKNFDETKITRKFGQPEKVVLLPQLRMLDLIVVGPEIHVHVVTSLIINPQHFYIQVDSLQDVEWKMLRNEMNEFYGNRNNRKMLGLHDVKKGHLVAVKNEHGDWHRCEVLDVYNNHCSVMYVDIGGESTVSVSDMYELSQHFSKYMVQAYECILSNVGEPSGGWKQKSIAKFKELCATNPSEKLCMHIKNTKIIIQSRGSTRRHVCVVDLYNGDTNIGKKLRREGYASIENTMKNYFKEIPKKDEIKISEMLESFKEYKEMNEDIDEEFRESLEFEEYESDDDYLPGDHANLTFVLEKAQKNKEAERKETENRETENRETEYEEIESEEVESEEVESEEIEYKETE